jgi:hypothetical protein
MAMVRFDSTPEDQKIIKEIARRAAQEMGVDFTETEMDITAVHLNGCPLRLQDLLDAPAFHFAHDIRGIGRHLDRRTGALTDFFLPRFAAPRSA